MNIVVFLFVIIFCICLFGDYWGLFVVIFGLMLVLFIFVEVMLKILVVLYLEKVVFLSFIILFLLFILLYFFVVVINGIINGILVLLRISFVSGSDDLLSWEELRIVVFEVGVMIFKWY